MILELDLGNTRAKWRVVNAGATTVARGRSSISDWVDGRFPQEWGAELRRVRVASVLSSQTNENLSRRIESELSLSPEFAQSKSYCAGVVNAYAEPERLGVDRWLALIAAYRKAGRAVLIVDAGTALKFDAVSDAGKHSGGYIIPGYALMECALLEGTDRVRYEGRDGSGAMSLGNDTRSCVQHGIAAALVGSVLVAVEQAKSTISTPLLYLTGGGAELLKIGLEGMGLAGIRLEPDLVLDGLQLALP